MFLHMQSTHGLDSPHMAWTHALFPHMAWTHALFNKHYDNALSLSLREVAQCLLQ